MASILQGQDSENNLILYVNDQDELTSDIEVDILAQVFIVEKEKAAGGNTSLSQAMVPAAGSRMQRELGIEDSARLMVDDILRKNDNESDPDLTLHIAGQSGRLVDWLEVIIILLKILMFLILL